MPAPFSEEDASKIVKDYISKNDTSDTNHLIQYILTELQPNTVDYKIIVTVTIMSQDAEHFHSKHSVGFLWNDETDGHYSLKFDTSDSWLLVGISYIKL